MRLATEAYVDPARFELESERIFHRVPLVMALSIDVPNPGDYTAGDIARRAVVTVRGDDGGPQLRERLPPPRRTGEIDVTGT